MFGCTETGTPISGFRGDSQIAIYQLVLYFLGLLLDGVNHVLGACLCVCILAHYVHRLFDMHTSFLGPLLEVAAPSPFLVLLQLTLCGELVLFVVVFESHEGI